MKRWTVWSWTVAFLPILAIIMLAMVGSVSASVQFSNYWGRVVQCQADDCVTFPLADSNNLNVSINAGDAVVVYSRILDCTANTNMGVTITDNGGNSYSQAYQVGFANCGTVDLFVVAIRTIAKAHATVLTMTQTNRPAGSAYSRAVFAAAAYTGVGNFGNQFTSAFLQGNQPFPWAETIQSLSGSWIVGMFFQQSGNQAIGSMNVGVMAGNTLDNFGSINAAHSSVLGGVSAGGHDCGTKLCVLPNFGSAHTWIVYGTELEPPTTADVTYNTAADAFWLLVFGMIVVSIVYGAYRIRTWGE